MKQDAHVETIFLPENRPLLPQAASWLRERFASGRSLDLSRVICVLPGRHAQRRFEDLVQWEAAEHDLQLSRPKAITVGGLPETLYSSDQTLAIEFEQTLAWAKVLQETSLETLRPLSPTLASDSSVGVWMELAATLRRLHEELASANVSFATVAEVAESETDRERWRLIDQLYARYLEMLATAGLQDASHARSQAVTSGLCRCDRTIVLIGTSDLSELLLEMLRSVACPRIALVAWDQVDSRRFNEFGSVITDAWQSHLLPIEDRHLISAGDIFDQSLAVAETLADYGQRFAADEITLGVTDESQVGPVEVELGQRGLAVHRQLGWTLSQTAVGRLLDLVHQFLERQTWTSLAALVRHADVYDFVERNLVASQPEAKSAGWIEQFDQLMANHYPVDVHRALPPTAASAYPKADQVRELIVAWTARLRGPQQPVSQWCAALGDCLDAIYPVVESGDPSAVERGFFDADNDEALGELDRTQLACRAMRRQLTRYAALSPELDVEVDAAHALEILIGRSAEIRIVSQASPVDLEILGWLDLALDDSPAMVVLGLNHPYVPQAVTSDPFLPGALRSKLGVSDNERRYVRDCYAMHLMIRSRPAIRFVVGRTAADGTPTPPSRMIAATSPEDCAKHIRHLLVGERVSAPLWHPWDDIPRRGSLRIPSLAPPRVVKTMSVTAFRDYLACPYRFYLRHVLKLRPIDDSASELAANQFGDLVHDAVEKFGESPDKHETNSKRIFDSLRDHLHAYAANMFGDVVSTAVRLQIAQAERRLRVVAERQAERAAAGWQIYHVEKGVSEETGAIIHVDGQPMGLRGRFDRIDYHPERDVWAILDYKTHGHKPEKKHLAKRNGEEVWIDLQLPLYRRMIPFLGIEAEPAQVELGYFNISGKDEETGIHLAEFTESLFAQADALITQVIRGVLEGRFEPSSEGVEFDDYSMILQVGIAERMFQESLAESEMEGYEV